jgi:two-component system LytT family response regulator
VLLVDDEPHARRKLDRFLRDEAGIDIVGESGGGEHAIGLIEALQPDVLFLDIHMPQMNGFELLSALEMDRLPLVVFVTAYDQFAVKAFEVHALDYVLKPFDRDRVQSCLERIREELKRRQPHTLEQRLERFLDQYQPRSFIERLPVRSRGRITFVQMKDVEWIAAAENYSELHVRGESYLVRSTLQSLEARLDPRAFRRVHRSALVNLEHVRELRPFSHNDFIIVMKDGAQVRMSRRYRANLSEAE